MRGTRACALFLSLVALFARPSSHAEDLAVSEQSTQLRARLDRIGARDDAHYADAAMGQATRALQRAGATEDPEAAARANEIARAALVLAERQLDRRAVQAELFETQRRLTATRERAKAQRRVLEALMRERAELARDGESP